MTNKQYDALKFMLVLRNLPVSKRNQYLCYIYLLYIHLSIQIIIFTRLDIYTGYFKVEQVLWRRDRQLVDEALKLPVPAMTERCSDTKP